MNKGERIEAIRTRSGAKLGGLGSGGGSATNTTSSGGAGNLSGSGRK